MKRCAVLMLIAAISVLAGCSVTMYGQQTTGGGSTATTTGSSVRGSTSVGNARIGGAFGALPLSPATGGQATFSGGASAVLVLSVVIAELFSDWFKPAAAPREALAPGGISHTCSCYGWQPEASPAPQPQLQ